MKNIHSVWDTKIDLEHKIEILFSEYRKKIAPFAFNSISIDIYEIVVDNMTCDTIKTVQDFKCKITLK